MIIVIYRSIESALLWYNLYVKFLTDIGFIINRYYGSVANNTINRKLCTKVWYADNNKIAHVDEKIVTKLFSEHRQNFGYLVVSRGENIFWEGEHEY